MLDITKKELYIEKLESVTQGYIPKRQIPLCAPRKSDGFVYILKGGCAYMFEKGYTFTASQGDLLYLSKNSEYTMDVFERYEFLVINFDFCDSEQRKSRVFTLNDGEIIENIAFKLLRRFRRHSDGCISDCMSLLYSIYSNLIKFENTAYMPNSTKYKLERAKDTIIQGFQKEISISELAKNAAMSDVYFRKLFRAAYGATPSEFIINCRISYAKELLRQNYLAISEIAEICGFSSTSYFCRAFKKSTGITPGGFISENRENIDRTV